jgi:hypothetical protein
MKRRQYTIRSIPGHVDRELRRRAKEQNKSLNSLIIEVLEDACRPQEEPKLNHDLDSLIGTWVEDPEFDEVMKEFERIDAEYWT